MPSVFYYSSHLENEQEKSKLGNHVEETIENDYKQPEEAYPEVLKANSVANQRYATNNLKIAPQ